MSGVEHVHARWVTMARLFVALAVPFYGLDLIAQLSSGLTNGQGRPFGDDHVNFWSGAYLAWHGRASEIYDAAAFHRFQQAVVGPALDGYHYAYPPLLLLLTAPLALIPYVPALAVWLAAGWYAFYRALLLAMPQGGALLLAAATPAVFINMVGGQNGTWTAALFGAGLGLLHRYPVVAGGLLGLLVYKPHLGLLLPIALIAGRHWRAFLSASCTVVLLIAISLWSFGPEIWSHYFRNLGALRQSLLEDGTGVFHRAMSVFVAARRLTGSVDAAYAIQGVSALLAAIAVVFAWYRPSVDARLKNAVLVLATCLTTPYLQDYDLVVGAMVTAWLWQAASHDAVSLRVLTLSCGLLLVGPLFSVPLAHATGLSFGPVFIVPAFVVALRYVTSESGMTRPPRPQALSA